MAADIGTTPNHSDKGGKVRVKKEKKIKRKTEMVEKCDRKEEEEERNAKRGN